MNFKYFALVGALLSVACLAKMNKAPEKVVVAEEVVVNNQTMDSAGAECLPMHQPYFKPISKKIRRVENMPPKCITVKRLVEEEDVYEVDEHQINTCTVCDDNGCRPCNACPPKTCAPCAKRVCNPCRSCK